MPAVGRCSQKMKKNDREIFHLFGGGEERGELFLFVCFLFLVFSHGSLFGCFARERESRDKKHSNLSKKERVVD